MMTDPISDMLARIRNAAMARHPELACPASNTKLAVARVLVDAGFLEEARVEAKDGRASLVLRNWWWEEGIKPDEPMEAAIADGLMHFARYLEAAQFRLDAAADADPVLMQITKGVMH